MDEALPPLSWKLENPFSFDNGSRLFPLLMPSAAGRGEQNAPNQAQELFPRMDEDRKYRQQGYMNSAGSERRDQDRPRAPRPKQPLDVTGPRLPRLVQSVAASRCYSCSATLPNGIDFKGTCPKCGAELHCCKQCAYFEPSTRFQCRQSIPERIAVKDQANECELFSPRVTVARDVRPPVTETLPIRNGSASQSGGPRSADDARAAFDSLFKK